MELALSRTWPPAWLPEAGTLTQLPTCAAGAVSAALVCTMMSVGFH